MHIARFPNRLLLLAAFVVCIALGFTLAVVLRERLGGGTAEEDLCFGQGELVDSWEAELTQEEIDEVSSSRPELADREPGMVEYRRCRWGAGYEVIIDEYGNVFSYSQPTLEELEAYYEEHPEENPWNELATREAERSVTDFVTPALPPADALADTIVAGCDPTWEKRDFPQIKLRLCYPPDWRVEDEDPSRSDAPVSIGNGVIGMTFNPQGLGEVPVRCAEPTVIETPAGDARLCALRPNIVEVGQGYDMALPIGRRANFFIREPSTENTALALRIALAAEELP